MASFKTYIDPVYYDSRQPVATAVSHTLQIMIGKDMIGLSQV